MVSASTPPLAMFQVPHNFVRFTVIISIQMVILAFGYGFLGAVAYLEYLAPSDPVCELMRSYPGELTMVVTLIATVLSVTAATLFTLSVKEALRHRMWKPISLIHLSTGVALAQGSHILKHRYMGLTILTLFIFGMLRLLTAGWTTLLTPNYFMWPVQLNGSELDITGSAFAALLREEFLASGLTDIQDNAFEILDIGAMISGVAAAGYTFGIPRTFNFNGVKYNVSTQGIVPTIESFSGSDGVPGANGTRLGFAGGNVTVNTGVIPGSHPSVPIPQGFSRNYSMSQQGLTADVSCRPIDSNQTQYLWDTNNSYVIYSNAAASSSNNSITGLRLWNIAANCGTNTLITYEYVTMVDANGNTSSSGSGFLPSIVCPGPVDMNQTYTSFAILTQGFYKYGFLQASVCEVVPLLTTVLADYSDEEISVEVISSTPFQPENAALLSFIASVVKFQSINSQGLTSSTIGDTLYSVYSSTTNESIDNGLNDTQLYFELEDYWRGVVEFSATFLRSGFMATGSFPNNEIPNNLSSQVTGTMFVSTIGWIRWPKNSPTYLLATIPLTIITTLTFFSALYSILEAWKEHQDRLVVQKEGQEHAMYQEHLRHRRAHFDVSNTLHLIMACAAGSLALEDFGRGGIINNEVVKVQLEENGDKKMFAMADRLLKEEHA
ncbi:hypothetical protein DFJ58DRAFT_61626 [Suillus subalutaceus]|uniref:uncharacterized protein n=1 Tax=Suillus subalutaceus TaxID=48586 RepID=UPI001B868F9E|nr:uncharacterized protein DFJ58DRAFT_61626 [Suillus subalutaceus]KAG1869366.1 hypothetical protein DFJ58DRAFT_61626 [Suillus subalutaceus]